MNPYENVNQSNFSNPNQFNNMGISQPLNTTGNQNNQSLPIINERILNRGKAVLGVQPLNTQNDNSYQDNYRKDEMTKRKFDEINSNLDIFRTELTNTMRKINKNQSKLKVDTVIEEITDFKNTFLESLKKAEKKKEEENDIILKEIKNLKNEVKRNYEESKSNYKVIRSFQDDIFDFEREITNRIVKMEQNQAEQFDKIYGLINNLTLLKQHGRGKGEIGDFKNLLDNEIYNKDNKNDRGLDKNLIDRLENAQSKNAQMEEETQKDSNALFAKGISTDLSDQYRIKEHENRLKEMPIIKHKLSKVNMNMKLKPKNKVMSILRGAYAITRFRNAVYESVNAVKLDALSFFVSTLKNSTTTIEDWVKNATKIPISSILKFESQEIDMSEMVAAVNNPPPEVKDTFIRLQTKIKGVIESIGNHLFSEPLDVTTMTWLRIPITSGYIVPYEFYYNFLLTRIPLSYGEITSLEKSHQLMILATYIFIHIFVGQIVITEMKATKSDQIRKNLKMIGSVFYHSLMKFFKERVKPINSVTNYLEFVKAQCRAKPDFEISTFKKESSVNYRKALKQYYEGKEKHYISMNGQAQNLLDKAEGKFHACDKDNNPNEIFEISVYMFPERQMNTYFKLADVNNFKVSNYILNVCNTFIQKIYSTEG